jgi:hypothetical protein
MLLIPFKLMDVIVVAAALMLATPHWEVMLARRMIGR